MDEESGKLAQEVAVTRDLLMFRNSDAHHVSAIGEFYNDVREFLRNNDDFIRMVLMSGKS